MERIAEDKIDLMQTFPSTSQHFPAPPATKTTLTQSPACSPAVKSKMMPYCPSETMT